jgi:pantothenate kinase-related protein Tda10
MNKNFQHTYSQIFNNSPQIFSCVTGNFDGTMKEVLSNEIFSFFSALNAKEVEAVSEDDFYSLSAYSERLKEKISLPTQQMNLQIGLRKNGLGAGTNFVIGTPIITTEY